MQYVIAEEINEISTNVTAQDFTEYDPAVTYNINDKVTVTADNLNYWCVADGVVGKTPNMYTKDVSTTPLWASSATNKNAMFSYKTSKQTIFPEVINRVITAVNIDTISFLNVDAKSIEITMTDIDTGEIIWTLDQSLVKDDIQDFADYLFSEQELTDSLTAFVSKSTLDAVIGSMTEQQILDRFTANPPIYYNASFDIKIKNEGSDAKCGAMIIGRKRNLGLSLVEGASLGILSYSQKTRDSYWGTVDYTKGSVFRTMSIPVLLEDSKDTTDTIINRIIAADASPCLFIGDESGNFSSATIFGFFRDFSIPINPLSAIYTLEIESLT